MFNSSPCLLLFSLLLPIVSGRALSDVPPQMHSRPNLRVTTAAAAALCGQIGQIDSSIKSQSLISTKIAETQGDCYDQCLDIKDCQTYAWNTQTLDCQTFRSPVIKLGFTPGAGPAWYDNSCPGPNSRISCGTNFTISEQNGQVALSQNTIDNSQATSAQACGALCSARGDCDTFGYDSNDKSCSLIKVSIDRLNLTKVNPAGGENITFYNRACAAGNLPSADTVNRTATPACGIPGGLNLIFAESSLDSRYNSSAGCYDLCQKELTCLAYGVSQESGLDCVLSSTPISYLDLAHSDPKKYTVYDRGCPKP